MFVKAVIVMTLSNFSRKFLKTILSIKSFLTRELSHNISMLDAYAFSKDKGDQLLVFILN